jgi:hypothetical protein
LRNSISAHLVSPFLQAISLPSCLTNISSNFSIEPTEYNITACELAGFALLDYQFFDYLPIGEACFHFMTSSNFLPAERRGSSEGMDSKVRVLSEEKDESLPNRSCAAKYTCFSSQFTVMAG